MIYSIADRLPQNRNASKFELTNEIDRWPIAFGESFIKMKSNEKYELLLRSVFTAQHGDQSNIMDARQQSQ